MTDTSTTSRPADGGTPAFDWPGALGDSFGSHRSLIEAKGWKGPADALASYAHLERAIGAEKLVLPGRDAKPEDWQPVWKRLGRPDTPEHYDLSGFNVPEGLPWDAGLQRDMLAEMHAAGLNSGQASRILSRYAALAEDGQRAAGSAAERSLQAAEASLRQEFAGAYEAKLDLANRAFRSTFGDALEEVRQMRLADGSFLGDNPVLVRAFARLGEAMAEDGPLPDGKRAGQGPLSAAEAAAEMERLKADPEFRKAYTTKDDPAAHRLAVEQMNRLHAAAFGGGR